MTLHFRRSSATALPRVHADSIPFSSAKIPDILSRFSVPAGSPAAADIRYTLAVCEAPQTAGVEAQSCVTSFESMVDFAASSLGTRDIHAMTTKLSTQDGMAPKQIYTVESVRPLPVAGQDKVVCHNLPYPYAVFVCHTTTADLYTVNLAGADGTKADALAACHFDVTPTFPGRKVSVPPGSGPACHFLRQDTRLWVRN